jgi:TonB family protein
MRLFVIGVWLVLLATSRPVPAQSKSGADQPGGTRRCKPKVVSQKSPSAHSSIHVRKGEKATGVDPLITFQILESGEVTNVHLKSSSGVADIDKSALTWIQSARYNHRPGCGVIESQATVTVDVR